MLKADLEKKHQFYTDNIKDWELYSRMYESGRPLLESVLYQHSRESYANYQNRLNDAYVINFAQAIIDVYNFYLTEKDVNREVEGLTGDVQWDMFLRDADLLGTNYNDFVDQAQKLSAVTGSIGVLVNRPTSPSKVLADDIEQGIYPYCCMYTPQNIYDWKFERNANTHRMVLTYLKLYEGEGRFLIWTQKDWKIYELEKVGSGYGGKIKLADDGINTLNEIPFVWMFNCHKTGKYPIGESDIKDISRIVVSIIQNCSAAEEVIKFAGFPIMREPMEAEGAETDDSETPIGVMAVKQFDPSLGSHAKPDWMESKILEPIEAILMWMDRKVDEIYRIAHLAGVFGQRVSSGTGQSGLSMRYHFSQLNTVLVKKSTNMNEADLAIIRLWLKWQKKPIGKIAVSRTREFSIDELSVVLDNVITTMKNVLSKTYRVKMQQKMVRAGIPDLNQETLDIITKEIEANTPATLQDGLMGPDWPENVKKDVRPADQAAADHSRDQG